MTALLAFLSALGISLVLDQGVWASAIVLAAVAAVAAIGMNIRRHGWRWPLALLGAALIVYVMFVHYHPLVEALGFVALAAAVVADLRLLRYQRNPKR